jgi:hypothetical protein
MRDRQRLTQRASVGAACRAEEEPRAASPSLVDDDPGVAYDEDLANRIRELIAGEPDVSEQTMFGGLVFLVDGKMSVAAVSAPVRWNQPATTRGPASRP